MNADQVLSFADSLRSHALRSGYDLNESNLFVHAMLMQAVQKERGASGERSPPYGALRSDRRPS